MSKKRKSNFGDKVGRNSQRQKESKKSFGYLNLPKGVPILNLEDGTTRVDLDFLPYIVTDTKHPDRDDQFEIAIPDSLWYRRPFKIHREVGVDNDTVICLRSIGKPCPICEFREKRKKEGADKEEIRELYPKERALYVVVPLSIKKYEEVPTIWDMSEKLFQENLNDELETSPEDRDFPDLENGKTLTLKLKWKKFGQSSFPDVRSIEFNERDAYPESILDEVPNLDDILKTLSYQTLEAKWFETDLEPDAGELHDIENDEKPVRRSRKKVEEEPEEETPVRCTRKVVEEDPDDATPIRSVRKKDSADVECPHGHKYGVDTEDFPKECDTCDIWSACLDVKEGK